MGFLNIEKKVSTKETKTEIANAAPTTKSNNQGVVNWESCLFQVMFCFDNRVNDWKPMQLVSRWYGEYHCYDDGDNNHHDNYDDDDDDDDDECETVLPNG